MRVWAEPGSRGQGGGDSLDVTCAASADGKSCAGALSTMPAGWGSRLSAVAILYNNAGYTLSKSRPETPITPTGETVSREGLRWASGLAGKHPGRHLPYLVRLLPALALHAFLTSNAPAAEIPGRPPLIGPSPASRRKAWSTRGWGRQTRGATRTRMHACTRTIRWRRCLPYSWGSGT